MILVDDGIATGASMLAAVRAVRAANPAQVVVAVPVGPASACRQLGEEADEVVCATMPPGFEAVGQVFADFHQVTDDEVRELLATPTTEGGKPSNSLASGFLAVVAVVAGDLVGRLIGGIRGGVGLGRRSTSGSSARRLSSG